MFCNFGLSQLSIEKLVEQTSNMGSMYDCHYGRHSFYSTYVFCPLPFLLNHSAINYKLLELVFWSLTRIFGPSKFYD